MSKLPFSEYEYDKLKMRVFPTIRRRDKFGDVGDVVTVEKGEYGNRDEIGDAEIIAKEHKSWRKLPERFRTYDCNAESLTQAHDHINGFYRRDIQPEEELTVYWLRWVE